MKMIQKHIKRQFKNLKTTFSTLKVSRRGCSFICVHVNSGNIDTCSSMLIVESRKFLSINELLFILRVYCDVDLQMFAENYVVIKLR